MSTFLPKLPIYHIIRSIYFIPYLPFCQSNLSILSFAPSTFIPNLPFYQSYLSILPFAPSHISYTLIYPNPNPNPNPKPNHIGRMCSHGASTGGTRPLV